MHHFACVSADDLVRKLPDDIVKPFDFVIADESHALKSPTAQRTQVACQLIMQLTDCCWSVDCSASTAGRPSPPHINGYLTCKAVQLEEA